MGQKAPPSGITLILYPRPKPTKACYIDAKRVPWCALDENALVKQQWQQDEFSMFGYT